MVCIIISIGDCDDGIEVVVVVANFKDAHGHPFARELTGEMHKCKRITSNVWNEGNIETMLIAHVPLFGS